MNPEAEWEASDIRPDGDAQLSVQQNPVEYNNYY
jgi:hypothetical protein